MNDNKYFSTGEFAKLANVSKQTLIFYDKKGIFLPEYKDNNNFRYYSLNQFDTLDILITLRDIGLSLNDIKKYLDTRTPQNAINILEKENNLVKKQIEHLKNIEKKIENKVNIIKKGIESEDISEPYIKECDEEFIIKSEQVESNDFKIITMEIIKFMNFCKKNYFFDNAFQIGAIVEQSGIRNNNFTNLHKFYIKINSNIDNEYLHIKPKGTYACINHKGSYESSSTAYYKLLNFIAQNNYKIIDDSYEDCLLDSFACNMSNDYLTQISILVKFY